MPNNTHVVPKNIITKHELLEALQEHYGTKFVINRTEAKEAVDRTLTTLNPELNRQLWAGEPMEIGAMAGELARFETLSGV